MPKPYPREFRDDVVRVARRRDPGVTLEQIADDFGIHVMTLSKWLRQAAVVWAYALVGFLINDQVKLLTCRVRDRRDTQADLPQDSSPVPTAVATSRT